MNMRDNALLAFWAWCFSGGLKFTFLAAVAVTRAAWPHIAALLH